ncbi:MAG TPA: hypothetical protein VMV49_17240, partial [Candidatus Deferrimicrobium sp.]|nr:hypothetical protein [Candidatus Deferrimicrobium sp.]
EALHKHQENLQKRHLLCDFSGLNQVVGGGFESSFFYLMYGSSHSINSTLLSMAVTAQLPPERGLNSSVVFIDNDNIFNPYTMIRLALSAKLNPNTVLSRIFVARAFIWNHLGEIVGNLEALLEESGAQIILISGLTTLFEGEFERKKHQMLLKIANKLRTIASDRGVIILASAQLAQGSAHKPAGGKIISHAPHVLIRVLQQGERITFKLMKHPSNPPVEIVQWLSQPKTPPHIIPLTYFLKKSQER